MTLAEALPGFAARLGIAAVTLRSACPGMFLLSVQLSVFRVPNPSVTPTSLQLNVIAAPGALLRYRLADRPVAAAAAPDPRLSASGWGEGHRGSS